MATLDDPLLVAVAIILVALGLLGLLALSQTESDQRQQDRLCRRLGHHPLGAATCETCGRDVDRVSRPWSRPRTPAT